MQNNDFIVMRLSLFFVYWFTDTYHLIFRSGLESTLPDDRVTRVLPSRFTYLRVLMHTRFTPTPAIRSVEQDISKIAAARANQAARIV